MICQEEMFGTRRRTTRRLSDAPPAVTSRRLLHRPVPARGERDPRSAHLRRSRCAWRLPDSAAPVFALCVAFGAHRQAGRQSGAEIQATDNPTGSCDQAFWKRLEITAPASQKQPKRYGKKVSIGPFPPHPHASEGRPGAPFALFPHIRITRWALRMSAPPASAYLNWLGCRSKKSVRGGSSRMRWRPSVISPAPHSSALSSKS